MKEKSLEQIIIESAKRRNKATGGVIVPGGQVRNWPVCMTCGREVDSCELKNVNSKSCEIVAKHHEAEDSIRITWDIPVRDASKNPLDDVNNGWAIKTAMRDWGPFDPTHIFDGSHRSGG